MSEQAFNWNELDPDDRVVRTVHAVAAYLNLQGDVVIRQEAREYGDDDSWVIVPLDACDRLISRLQALMREARNG